MKARLFVIGCAVLALCGAQQAEAGVSLNTIDRYATYTQEGALVRSTGPIGCTRGERITIRVSVSQPATGARASGKWKGGCTGEVQHWQVRARAGGEARFVTGRAQVRAVARTRAAGRVTDTHRWSRQVSVAPPVSG